MRVVNFNELANLLVLCPVRGYLFVANNNNVQPAVGRQLIRVTPTGQCVLLLNLCYKQVALLGHVV
ncbi:MAG: hypothetical protein H7320_04985 [Ferruginibacter sp.]|nr:hypothetical protein [Ferruginibacter sp.]